MSAAVSVQRVNRLIEGLPRKERDRVLSRCEPADLVAGDVLCEQDQIYQDVYFPTTGSISLVAVVSGHPPLGMQVIGDEGMLGATLVLGVDAAPLRAVVHGTGTAWRMSAQQFRQVLRECPGLDHRLNAYLYVLMEQLSQAAACKRFHEVQARLARLLLMTQDCAHADRFHLTHQQLADTLGVLRSAVTIAAGALQEQHFIRYTRGEISVLSRKGLEDASCECYGAVLDDYTRQFT